MKLPHTFGKQSLEFAAVQTQLQGKTDTESINSDNAPSKKWLRSPAKLTWAWIKRAIAAIFEPSPFYSLYAHPTEFS